MTKKKSTPTPATAAPVALTAAQIEKLERDQRQLKAIIRALNLFDIGQPNQSPSSRVMILLAKDEGRKDTILHLIARKTPQPYL